MNTNGRQRMQVSVLHVARHEPLIWDIVCVRV